MKARAEAARLSMDRAMGDEAVVFRDDGSSELPYAPDQVGGAQASLVAFRRQKLPQLKKV
jgi:hypothetical protein